MPQQYFQPKMVGREGELNQLQIYLDKTFLEPGNTIFISGEAGIGKTRFLNELKQVAQSKGFQILSGNCMYESLTPFMPIMEALRSGGLESFFAEEAPRVEAVYLVTNAGLLIKEVVKEETVLNPDVFASMFTTVTDFVNESLSKLSSEEEKGTLNSLGYQNYRILIENFMDTNLVVIVTGKENEFLLNDMKEILSKITKTFKRTLKEWDGDDKKVAGIEELLLPLITSGKYDGIYYGKEDPKTRRNLLFENVSLGLARQAKTTPTLLCIEDLQWADPSSLALMHYIGRNTKDSGLLILGTYRPEDVAAEDGKGHPLIGTMQLMDREDLLEKMELPRLPEEIIDEFLTSMLQKIEFTDDFKKRIYKETEGNPLFIIELVKFLVDEKVIQNIQGTWKLVKPLKEGTIPSKVLSVISRRLDRVENKDRKALDYASVIGEVFDSNVLANILEMDRVTLLERLRYLEQTHRLIHPQNGNFKFDHAKIKEALYNEIPEELRGEYHLKIADSLETLNKDNLEDLVGDLAFHFYKCKNKEKALNYLIKAAEKAKKDYSNEEAIKFYNFTLELEDDPQTRLNIFEDMGAIYDIVGNFGSSIISYKNALNLAEAKRKKAELTAKIGGILEKERKFEEAMKSCTEALDMVKNEECKEKALALHNIGHLNFSTGQYEKALEFTDKAHKIYQNIGDLEGVALSGTSLGDIHDWRGEFDKAIEYLEKSLKIVEKSGNLYGIATSLTAMGIVYEKKGELEKAMNYLERGLQIYEKIGDTRGCIASYTGISDVLNWKGYHHEAVDIMNKCIKLSEKIGDRDYLTIRFNSVAALQAEWGEYQKAIDYYNESIKIAQNIGSPLASSAALHLLGVVYLFKGELNTALELIKDSLKISEKVGIPWGIAASNDYIGRIYNEKGDYDTAIKYLMKSLKILEGMGAQWGVCNASNGLARAYLGKGDIQKALDISKRTHKLSGKIGSIWQLGESGRIQGMIYREQEKWEESQQFFQTSIDHFNKSQNLNELGKSHLEFGLMWKGKGDSEKAKEHFDKSIELFDKLKLEKKKENVISELESLEM